MKRFQQIPHVYFVKIVKRSLTAPCFQSINVVHSSYSGNRQTRMTTVTLTHAHRGLMSPVIVMVINNIVHYITVDIITSL